MFDWLGEFHFIRPYWLFAFLPSLFVVVALLKSARQNSAWNKAINVEFLAVLSSTKKTTGAYLEAALLGLILSAATIALAGPTWSKISAPVAKNQSSTVILFDLSPSMLAEDLNPSRLVLAKFKLTDFLNAQKDGLTALVAYAGDAHVVTPLTDDNRTIISLLNTLSPSIMPARGSNIEEAFGLAQQLLTDSGTDKGRIIVISDGIAESAEQALVAMARMQDHELAIWGIGTDTGAPIPLGNGQFARKTNGDIFVAGLNEEYLSSLASMMGGLYVPYSPSTLDVDTIKSFTNRGAGAVKNSSKNALEQERNFDQWEEYGRYLLLPIIVLFMFLFRRGWAAPLAILTITVYPNPSQALPFEDLLLTDDQKAQRALEDSEYEKAAELFDDPSWRAAAEYKSGDFESAATYYGQKESAADKFNYGNSLALQRKYQDALSAYDAALELNPEFDKAQFNRDIVEQLIKQQEQQQQKQDSDQNSDGQQSENSESDSDNQESSEQNSEQASNDQSQAGDSNQNEQQQGSQENKNNEQQNGSNSEASDQQDGEETGAESMANEQSAEEQKSTDKQQRALDEEYGNNEDDSALENDAIEVSSDDSRPQEAPTQEEPIQEKPGERSEEMGRAAMSEEEILESEQQQELDQWLRRVPDDPGRLMRNKFAQQYREKQRLENSRAWRNPPNTEERW